MDGREGWRERVRDIRAGGVTCWWYTHTHTHTHIYIYIYIYMNLFISCIYLILFIIYICKPHYIFVNVIYIYIYIYMEERMNGMVYFYVSMCLVVARPETLNFVPVNEICFLSSDSCPVRKMVFIWPCVKSGQVEDRLNPCNCNF